MGVSGIPVRIATYQSTATINTSYALDLYYPGTRTLRPLSTGEIVVLLSLIVVDPSGGPDFILNSTATGVANPPEANILMVAVPGPNENMMTWHEGESEAMSGVPGVPLYIQSASGGDILAATGTGVIITSPGTTRPSFMNSLVPNG